VDALMPYTGKDPYDGEDHGCSVRPTFVSRPAHCTDYVGPIDYMEDSDFKKRVLICMSALRHHLPEAPLVAEHGHIVVNAAKAELELEQGLER
jgi:hypothetical protein